LPVSRVTNASGLEDLLSGSVSAEERQILSMDAFHRTLGIERKRTERTKEPFLLMLVDGGDHQNSDGRGRALDGVITTLVPFIRETDVIGWYKERATIGVIFTGLAPNDRNSTLGTLLNRVSTALQDTLTSEQFGRINISFHFFPDDWDGDGPGGSSNPALYPDLDTSKSDQRTLLGIKRVMDVLGSALLLIASLPLFAMIATAIKTTSRGPVFYRQQRVGQHGRRFTFLKFRSMYVDNDHSIHREYVKQLIAGSAGRVCPEGTSDGVYKLANDPRITRIGRFLRRTSLDELPQFLNVLWGDMSLVGPRPPIPYELAAYQTWHRRRLLQVKPGITGLWQVTGRSRVSFDDMVRLDLQYATLWSPWLDVKILLRTPSAVIKGAY
jgi:lipopolysaccharide/colanic/teichoic acid biosynthesis glycosyltransferase